MAVHLLLGLGLEERTLVPTRSWKLLHHDFEAAPELWDALIGMTTRLGLRAPA